MRDGGPDVEAVYEDIGELDAGSLAGLKALYSDARKRAAVAAGIGAYLYTALASVVLPIGPAARQVQAIRRAGKSDLLVLSAETEQWLRDGYRARMSSLAALRDLGSILAHGEPDDGMGQGESTDRAAHATETGGDRGAPPTIRRRPRPRWQDGEPATASGDSSPSTSARSARTPRPPPEPRRLDAGHRPAADLPPRDASCPPTTGGSPSCARMTCTDPHPVSPTTFRRRRLPLGPMTDGR